MDNACAELLCVNRERCRDNGIRRRGRHACGSEAGATCKALRSAAQQHRRVSWGTSAAAGQRNSSPGSCCQARGGGRCCSNACDYGSCASGAGHGDARDLRALVAELVGAAASVYAQAVALEAHEVLLKAFQPDCDRVEQPEAVQGRACRAVGQCRLREVAGDVDDARTSPGDGVVGASCGTAQPASASAAPRGLVDGSVRSVRRGLRGVAARAARTCVPVAEVMVRARFVPVGVRQVDRVAVDVGVTTNPGAGSAAQNASPGQRLVYGGIDHAGRVGTQETYSLATGKRLHKTSYGWDTAGCRAGRNPEDSGKPDNNLCQTTRHATGVDSDGPTVNNGTDDERTQYRYTPEGLVLRERRLLGSDEKLDTTYGYLTQRIASREFDPAADDDVVSIAMEYGLSVLSLGYHLKNNRLVTERRRQELQSLSPIRAAVRLGYRDEAAEEMNARGVTRWPGRYVKLAYSAHERGHLSQADFDALLGEDQLGHLYEDLGL